MAWTALAALLLAAAFLVSYLLKDELSTRPAALLARFAIDIGDKVQKLHSLNHFIIYWLVHCCRPYLKPARFALCPHYICAISHLPVGEARHVPYLNFGGLVRFLEDCIRVSRLQLLRQRA